jgi:hypothetical protein
MHAELTAQINEITAARGMDKGRRRSGPHIRTCLLTSHYMMQFIPGRADMEAKLRTAIKTELLEFKANGKTRKARRTVGLEWTRAHEKAGPVLYILCLLIWRDIKIKPTISGIT